MKIIWNIESIPEFEGLDNASAKEAWMEMYGKVRSEGSCRSAPFVSGGACALVIFLVAFLMSFFPSIPDFARIIVMVAFAGVGGYLGGVLAMSMNYRAGRKYLRRDLPRASEEGQPR